MDLFDYMRETNKKDESPLASRMRPESLDEIVDIGMVNAVNADFAGFIMSSRFWRYTEPAKVKELHGSLKKGIMAVGVFVDEPVGHHRACTCGRKKASA